MTTKESHIAIRLADEGICAPDAAIKLLQDLEEQKKPNAPKKLPDKQTQMIKELEELRAKRRAVAAARE